MRKLFVWDFHGTLEKGNDDAVLEISNLALSRRGHDATFSYDDMKRLSGLPWHEYFKCLLPDASKKECMELQHLCESLAFSEGIVQKHIRANDHALYVLDEISRRHSQILISNCSPETLDIILKHTRTAPYFTNRAFPTISNGKSRTKLSVLADYLVHHPFDRIITVGDSPDDMLLNKTDGVTTYLYAHPGYEFKECESDYRIEDLRDVLREL